MSSPRQSPLWRVYGCSREFAEDAARLSEGGYVVWLGCDNGEGAWCVYVPEDRLRARSLRWAFPQVFDATRAIINHHDPQGLIKAGAPQDEYEGEVSTILVRLAQEAKSVKDVLRIIHAELADWFGPASVEAISDFDVIAQEIWDAWKDFQGALIHDWTCRPGYMEIE